MVVDHQDQPAVLGLGANRALLDNGCTVLVEEVPGSRSISAGVWVKAGSRHDPPAAKGLAHIIEHLLFKGTLARSAEQIALDAESVGAMINAATGKETTFYYADAPSEGLDVVLDVLADLVLDPALDPDELERERGVLLEEIRNRDDDPDQCAYEWFFRELWTPPHPLGEPILGDCSTVETITRNTVAVHHHACYAPSNCVVVVCGAVPADRVMGHVEKWFSRSKTFSGSSVLDPTFSPTQPAPAMRLGERFLEHRAGQTHIYVALPVPDIHHEDRFPLELLNTVLGDGMSSRLFQEIREKHGLAYSVASYVSRYSDAGAWILYAGVSAENARRTRDLLMEQLTELRRHGVSPQEIKLAKAKLRGHLILSLETNGHRMARLGNAAALGRPLLSVDEVIHLLDSVSDEEIERVIDLYVKPDRLNLSVIGPEQAHVAVTEAER
ncbi:insulinase family protein [Candidatus Bipolaricaulota bacterium]|nr:insulinase family protein [Candidatus Bipolaricaulota bacterium]